MRVVAITAFVLLIAGLGLDSMDRDRQKNSNVVRRSAGFVSMPFMRAGAQVHRGLESFWTGMFSTGALQRENEELREELMRLQVETLTTSAVNRLDAERNLVTTNIPRLAMDLVSAPVLGETPSKGKRLLWIGSGANEGLKSGMVAVGPHGVIGAVDEVYEASATIKLVSDFTSSWGVEIADGEDLGLLKGTGDPERAELHFGRTVANVTKGQSVISSGMASSVAPGGLPFGTVESVKTNKQGEPVAVVKLADKATDLRTVFLLPAQQIASAPPR